jgi:hypothetical protein
MDQDQLDEIEAISSIFVDEYTSVPLEQVARLMQSFGWSCEEELHHVCRLSLKPQPDDQGQVHGKCNRLICLIIFDSYFMS